jgi:hypothetical protein
MRMSRPLTVSEVPDAEAGYRVIVAGPGARHPYHEKHRYPCVSDASIFDMREHDFVQDRGGQITYRAVQPVMQTGRSHLS